MGKRSWTALVVSVLALVVALSGTAMSAVIITKNSQVAAHTIGGASAPKGDNQNLIPGSVGAADLHTGAVTAKKLAAKAVGSSNVIDGSLTSKDLNLDSVAKGLAIDRAYKADAPGTANDPLFALGPWTVEGSCVDDGSGTAHATIDIAATGSPDFVSINGATGQRFTGTATLVQTGTVGSGAVDAKGASFTAVSAIYLNHLEGQVMAVVDGNVSDWPAGPVCLFTFGGLGF